MAAVEVGGGVLAAVADAVGHETVGRSPDTAALLERLRRTDGLLFHLHPANVLHVDGRLTGIVDWDAPCTGAAEGDRGFSGGVLDDGG